MTEKEEALGFWDLPNLRHLRALSLAARHGSVKKAAAEIFLSQPAVSQAIGSLEAEFSQTFFDRSASGFFLTAVGEILVRRIDRALAELDRACRLPEGRLEKRGGDVDPARMISTSQLRAIIAIANSGSFTMAARTLGMSRPSVQRAARSLENTLSFKLFVRTNRGVGLSAAGEVFARRANLAAREIELAREEIDQYWGQKVGRMVIGSLPLSLVDLVPLALMRVLDQLPDLNVRIIEGPYDDQLEALRYGNIDMVIGALRDPVPRDDVVQRTLFDDALSVVVRSSHPLTRHSSLSLSDTVGYPWVVPHPGTPTRQLFHAAFRRRALAEPKRLLEVSSHSSLRALLTGSDRVAMISRRQIRYEEEAKTLCVLPIDLPDTVRQIGLTTRADWEPSAAQKLFIEQLESVSSSCAPVEDVSAFVNKTRKGASRAPG